MAGNERETHENKETKWPSKELLRRGIMKQAIFTWEQAAISRAARLMESPMTVNSLRVFEPMTPQNVRAVVMPM